MITYSDKANISAQEAIDLYIRSTLGERRPIGQMDTFTAMLTHANLMVSAWHEDKLVGIAKKPDGFCLRCLLSGFGRRSAIPKTRHRQAAHWRNTSSTCS